MQITLHLYINIQAIFCWNRGQDTIYPFDQMFGPPQLRTKGWYFYFSLFCIQIPFALSTWSFWQPAAGQRGKIHCAFTLIHLSFSHLENLAFLQSAGEFGKFLSFTSNPSICILFCRVQYRQFCVPLLWSVWVTYPRWENMAEHFKRQCFVLNYCDSVWGLSGFLSNENQLYSTYWQKYLCPPHTAIFSGDHETARAFVWSQI